MLIFTFKGGNNKMKCEICGKEKDCYQHPNKNEWSCIECYDKTYFKNGKKRGKK